MPKRPTVRAPAFGKWLEDLRGPQSFEAIAQRVRPLVDSIGLKVDRSSLKKLEQGRLPNWPMVAALSHVHRVPITETVQRLVAALEFPGSGSLLSTAAESAPVLKSQVGRTEVPLDSTDGPLASDEGASTDALGRGRQDGDRDRPTKAHLLKERQEMQTAFATIAGLAIGRIGDRRDLEQLARAIEAKSRPRVRRRGSRR